MICSISSLNSVDFSKNYFQKNKKCFLSCIKESLPGPPLAICSPTSKSLVTGFPGNTSFTVDIVENTVDDTEEDTADRIFSSLLR